MRFVCLVLAVVIFMGSTCFAGPISGKELERLAEKVLAMQDSCRKYGEAAVTKHYFGGRTAEAKSIEKLVEGACLTIDHQCLDERCIRYMPNPEYATYAGCLLIVGKLFGDDLDKKISKEHCSPLQALIPKPSK